MDVLPEGANMILFVSSIYFSKMLFHGYTLFFIMDYIYIERETDRQTDRQREHTLKT